MSESVYRVTELVGVSNESWEAAARNAVETASKTVRNLRVAEAHRFDVTIQDGKVDDLPRACRRVVQVRIGRLSASRPCSRQFISVGSTTIEVWRRACGRAGEASALTAERAHGGRSVASGGCCG